MYQVHRREVLAVACGALLPRLAGANQATTSFIQGVSKAEARQVQELGEAFRSKFDLPGVSLAMSYRGKLKLLACFGYANREVQEPVRPRHQFRVASVSKPITSVAILRLIERGKLSLGDRLFTDDGQLPQFASSLPEGKQQEWIQRITVRHLLEHSCGGWSNKNGEAPMFAKDALGMSHAELIRWTLKNMPLTSAPGTRYAYSNFGYCLLGRVIESVTGESYEQSVRKLVLQPAGARRTLVGGHHRDQRRPNEVIYYDKFDPYGVNMDVARMDAHGGWISTPTDLVRFAQRVDGFESPTDILRQTTIKTMTTPSRGTYALGWRVNRQNNWWHTGSFNGGSSILARIHDGHCWAVVVNTRSRKEGYKSALDKFPWQVKAAVRQWGRHDLFATQ